MTDQENFNQSHDRPDEDRPYHGGLHDRRAPAAPMLSLNFTPMIDVVFLLLIYFILSSDFRPREEAFSLDAPQHLEGATIRTLDPFELPKRPVRITVRSHGDGSQEYSISSDDPTIGPILGADDLFRRLSDARGRTIADDQVFAVRAAPDTRWEHTLAAFNAIRRAGFQQVRFSNPEKPAAGGSP